MASKLVVRRDQRGFPIFGEFTDSRAQQIRVKLSSECGGPYCWIFAEGGPLDEPTPYLTVQQARKMIAALERFLSYSGAKR